jgi:hypothetical protein
MNQELRGQKYTMGVPANARAVTRVNPEQASKVKMWTPTRLDNGEGRSAEGKEPTRAPFAVHRGNGNSTWGRSEEQRGKLSLARVRCPRHGVGSWPVRVAERLVVPVKPGNAGGGKGPYFWVLLKEPRQGD